MNSAGGWPVGVAYALEVHLEEADRIFAGYDLVANFMPRAIFDYSRIADGHRSGRDFPHISISGWRKHEVTHITLRIGVEGVSVLR